MENNELGGLLISRCRDRDPGGPPEDSERLRSWIPTVAAPWKKNRRLSNYSRYRKPPLLSFCNTSRTTTCLILGLRILQHWQTQPTSDNTALQLSKSSKDLDQFNKALSRTICHPDDSWRSWAAGRCPVGRSLKLRRWFNRCEFVASNRPRMAVGVRIGRLALPADLREILRVRGRQCKS